MVSHEKCLVFHSLQSDPYVTGKCVTIRNSIPVSGYCAVLSNIPSLYGNKTGDKYFLPYK